MFKTAYGPRERVSMDFLDAAGDPIRSATKQCFKESCDINNILPAFDKQGVLSHVNEAQAFYGDFSEINEYQVSLNQVIAAQASFDSLPSSIRRRFGNDPGEYFEFVTNPNNIDEMVDLGLAIVDDPVPELVPAPPVKEV